MIEAKIVADSIAPSGARLTTFVLTYPRFIHSEFMTHRMFSRNASSSRAIPVAKQIQMVRDNPAIPLAFTRNKPGMQGGAPLEGQASDDARSAWIASMLEAVRHAEMLVRLDVHKQYANRILEPYAHITVVCTATDYDNFFALRCHEMAQPEIRELAEKMYVAMSINEPDEMVEGEWHLPFVSFKEQNRMMQSGGSGDEKHSNLVKMSVARCARVSYLNHEGKQPTLEEDLQLYSRLLGQLPIHASPAEHQARAESDPSLRSGNFRGWIQYRKTLQDENIEKFEGSK